MTGSQGEPKIIPAGRRYLTRDQIREWAQRPRSDSRLEPNASANTTSAANEIADEETK